MRFEMLSGRDPKMQPFSIQDGREIYFIVYRKGHTVYVLKHSNIKGASQVTSADFVDISDQNVSTGQILGVDAIDQALVGEIT